MASILSRPQCVNTAMGVQVVGWLGGWPGGQLVPDFSECISLIPLDGFSPFEVLWNCLHLKMCNVVVICPFTSYGLAHGPKSCQIWFQRGRDLAECLWNLLNYWTDFLYLKIFWIIYTCSLQIYGHLPIWPIWACPWTRTCISESAGRIFSIRSSMELSGTLIVQHHGHLTISPLWACPWLPIWPIWACPSIGMHISETV